MEKRVKRLPMSLDVKLFLVGAALFVATIWGGAAYIFLQV